MSKLPNEMRRKLIEDMKMGETGYTLPWAINVDENSNMEIRMDYPVSSVEENNMTAKITMRHGCIEVSRHSIRNERYREGHHWPASWGIAPVELVL